MKWYPWLRPHFEKLIESYQAGRGHHALLIQALPGMGDDALIYAITRFLMCQQPQGHKSCGKCRGCQLMQAGTHPDYYTLEPEKGKSALGIDAVREVSEKLYEHARLSGAKVVWLKDAAQLTEAAANALLKTLEEPPERTVFFLITDQPAALLPTIVSRCRVVRFHPLTEEACQKRLIALGQSPEMAKKKARIAEGCVGRALEIDDGQLDLRMELTHNVFSVHHPADALGVVNMYKEDKERQKLVLDTLEIALRDILVQQAGGASVADAGYAREALDYASRVPLSGGLTLMETLRRARVMLASNVAFTSAFETVLLQISEEYAKWPW